jgi:hypothetical protein
MGDVGKADDAGEAGEASDAREAREASEASDAREAREVGIVITRFPRIFRGSGMIRFSLAIAAGAIFFVLSKIWQNVLQM